MTDRRTKEGRTLDGIVEMCADDGLPSLKDAQETLRSAGLDPDEVGRSLREQLVRATWRRTAEERRKGFRLLQGERPPRPAGLNREALLARIDERQPRAVAFRNADEMSDDDLWDLLCDLELGDEE